MLSNLLFITCRWLDVIAILLVAIIMFQLYKLVKETVAIKIFLGILAIYLFWKIVEALQMELLSEILGQFIGVGVLALIIVFQQEIRRFLLLISIMSLKDSITIFIFEFENQFYNYEQRTKRRISHTSSCHAKRHQPCW
jgi:DNA integrity scanning protein DisA with diadenylate cyclase activity